jgi:hypothetical protein
MQQNNNGGYANSWLLADVNTGEIMRFELGLKLHNVERTRAGYYIGFNGALDPRIRNLEAGGNPNEDIRVSVGARQVRLTELMEQNLGRLDAEKGKAILADHYDVYLQKEQPSTRTVDGHHELDPQQFGNAKKLPFTPGGSVDGKVIDRDLAKNMSFWARWGNSCGRPFNAKAFLKEHPQWRYLDGYLKDRPSQPWVLFRPETGHNQNPMTESVYGLILLSQSYQIMRNLKSPLGIPPKCKPEIFSCGMKG